MTSISRFIFIPLCALALIPQAASADELFSNSHNQMNGNADIKAGYGLSTAANYHYGDDLCESMVAGLEAMGSSEELIESFASTCAATSPGLSINATGSAATKVKFFGTQKCIANIGTMATMSEHGAATHFFIKSLGATLYTSFGEDVDGVEFTDDEFISETFYEKEKRFVVGVVPMSITAAAVGRIGGTVAVSADSDGLSASVTPETGIDAVVTAAALDVEVAEFGVLGSLELVTLQTPFEANVEIDSNDEIVWNVNFDTVISTMSGYIAVYVDSIFGGAELEIGSWDGWSWNQTWYEANGAVQID